MILISIKGETGMVIEKLKKGYTGKKFEVKYFTKGYYDIERVDNGFEFWI